MGEIKKKKKVFKIIFFGVAFTSLVACSNGDSAKPAGGEGEASTSEVEKQSTESSSSEVKSVENSSEDAEANSKYFDLMIEAAQSQVPALKEQMGDMYSDISITGGEDHTIVYTYTLAENPVADMDIEALKPTLAKSLISANSAIKGAIPDAKYQLFFLRPDQSEIGSTIITQEDIVAVQEDSGEEPAADSAEI